MFKKVNFSILALLVSATISLAQIGVNVGYNVNNALDWKVKNANNDEAIANFYTNGMSYGIDYWFRVKKYRIEFTPEVNFSSVSTKNTVGDINFQSTVSTFNFFANTNFYIFEFKGDCNCPTFSKPGLELEKGFFIRLSPGVSYFTGKLSSQNTDLTTEFKDNSLAYSVGVGIGIDFGISDFITITPIITYRYYFSPKWENLPLAVASTTQEWVYPTEITDISQIYGGIRLGVRFDYRK